MGDRVYTVDALHTKGTWLTSTNRDNFNSNSLKLVQSGSSSNTCTTWSGLESPPMRKAFSDPVLITAQMGRTRAGSIAVEDEAIH